MNDLDRLDVLAAAATPGPWVAQSYDDGSTGRHPWYIDTHAYSDGPEPVVGPTYPLGTDDAAFIAACDPATIRSLVAAVRERDELREAAGAVMLALEPEVLPRTLNRKIPVLQYDSASIARLRAALHREADQGGATDA